jgi:hypothetical protein
VITTTGQHAQINPSRLAKVIGLEHGGHADDLLDESGQGLSMGDRKIKNKKVCIMEAVAYVCNLEWTDHPGCVDPFLITFGIYINDHHDTTEELRNSLIPLIPKIVNTDYATPETKLKRRYETLRLILHELLPWWMETALRPITLAAEKAWYDEHVLNEPDLRQAVQNCQERAYELESSHAANRASLVEIYSELQGYIDSRVLDSVNHNATPPVGRILGKSGAMERIIAIYNQVIDIRDPDLEEAAMQEEVVAQIAKEDAYRKMIAKIKNEKVPVPVSV